MSKRRQVGDWVWLSPNSGFIGESNRLRAEIRPGDPAPCFICDDKECKEWSDLWTEPDPLNDNKRHLLCHVSECQMSDTKQ